MSCASVPTAADEPLGMFHPADNGQFDKVLVEGLANPLQPKPLCTLTGFGPVLFISPTEFGYVTNTSFNDPIHGTATIARISVGAAEPTIVATADGDVMDFAWSPDGSELAYLLYTSATLGDSTGANQLWLKSQDAPPRAVTPLMPVYGRDGRADDETIVSFSANGKYLLMIDTFVACPSPGSAATATVQVRSVPDGNLVWAPQSALPPACLNAPSMVSWGLWAHRTDRVYYHDSSGVHVWDAATSTVSDLIPGMAWMTPSLSPDDRLVAYQHDVNGRPRVDVRDLVTGSVRTLPALLGDPLLLSTSALVEFHMQPNTGQGPPYLADSPYLFDLSTGKETALPQGFPGAVFPG